MDRIIRTVFLTMLAVMVAVASRAADTVERWYVVKVWGKPAGWSVMRVSEEAGRITTFTRMQLTIARGNTPLALSMESTFVETADGRPVSASTVQGMGASVSRSSLEFGDSGAVLSIQRPNSPPTTQPYKAAKPWMCPDAARRYLAQQLKAGSKTITYRMLDPDHSYQPEEVTVEVVGQANIEVFGKTVPAIEQKMRVSSVPGLASVDYTDEQGWSLKSTMDMGILSFSIEQADEQLAKAKIDPPELLAQTLVKLNVPIANPRQARSLRFRVQSLKGELPDLPVTGYQSVHRLSPRQALVIIDLDRPSPATQSADTQPSVVNSPLADGTDAKVVQLHDQALGELGEAGRGGAAARAEALRRFVHGFIQEKDLSVGLASAGEVARTGQGDCTEHAVLLAGLLRADGTPSRVVSGLLYVDEFMGQKGVMGYHMWTQAWLNGYWVDMDATLEEAFDATHLALAISNLDQPGLPNDLVSLAPLIGTLRVSIPTK